MPTDARHDLRKAFSLIELLVVIATIMTLEDTNGP